MGPAHDCHTARLALSCFASGLPKISLRQERGKEGGKRRKKKAAKEFASHGFDRGLSARAQSS